MNSRIESCSQPLTFVYQPIGGIMCLACLSIKFFLSLRENWNCCEQGQR